MKHGSVFLFGLLGSALSACGASKDNTPGVPPGDESSEQARTNFFEDFHASRYSRASADAELLREALSHTDSGPLAFDMALAHSWHLAEWRRDAKADPGELAKEGQQQASLFQTASEKNPDDARVDCFLGLSLLDAGRATQNEELKQQGAAILGRGIDRFPEFNLFCKGLGYDRLPADDPDFEQAVDAAWQTLDVCFGEKVDRTDPDITPYLNQATDRGRKRVCWNDPIAPHNAEGFYLWMGDVLVKHGDLAQAVVIYQNAQRVREYSAWPFKSLIEERLGADLGSRAALYHDTDADNDPPLAGDAIGRSCGYCHAATVAE